MSASDDEAKQLFEIKENQKAFQTKRFTAFELGKSIIKEVEIELNFDKKTLKST